MKITSVIVTYNQPEALGAILRSIRQQRVLPGEVIIADDGSDDRTARLIQSCQDTFPVPLKHVWHRDQGFRAAAIRNKAIGMSTGDYLVFSDGDLVFHPCFFLDMARRSEKGALTIGSRVFLTPQATRAFLSGSHLPPVIPFYSASIGKNRMNAIRIPLLSPLFSGISFSTRLRGGLTGVWKSDLEAVNGWNEAFTGWGYEDTELVARLFNYGIRLNKCKFSAITYHLWHTSAERTRLGANRDILDNCIMNRQFRCDLGLVQSDRS